MDAVYLADVLAVQEHLGIVMCLGDLQHTLRLCALCHAGAVQQASPSHVHLLEGLQSAVLLCRSGQVAEEGGYLGKGHLGETDGGVLLGYGRQFLTIVVAFHHLAQFEVLGCGLSSLVDGGIIVIARHIGCKTG